MKKNKTEIKEIHRTWHQFSSWIGRTFGEDLIEEKYMEFGDEKIKFKDIDEYELSKRLVGYEVMDKVEKYVKRYCPQIKIVRCDDVLHASSDIILVPHPAHGITVIYIPQCTCIQNQFFLYGNHWKKFIKELQKMGEEIFENKKI